jgi:hypothetical protein
MKGKLRLKTETYNRLLKLAGDEDLGEFILSAVQKRNEG